MNDRELQNLDDFIVHAQKAMINLEHYSQFLKLSPQEELARKRAIEIINEKMEILDKAEKMSQVKEVIRVKKIIRGGE